MFIRFLVLLILFILEKYFSLLLCVNIFPLSFIKPNLVLFINKLVKLQSINIDELKSQSFNLDTTYITCFKC